MSYSIIKYSEKYHEEWVKCRIEAFLDSSFYDDVYRTKKSDSYVQHSVELSFLSISEDKVIGFIDIEYETIPKTVCHLKGELGAVMWHIGVLKEYRRQGVAKKLFDKVIAELKKQDITRLEAWTQDDIPANKWYLNQGFVHKESYLNAFINGQLDDVKEYLNIAKIGSIFGIRRLNFEAPIERKEELSKICHRLHEVKLYELELNEYVK